MIKRTELLNLTFKAYFILLIFGGVLNNIVAVWGIPNIFTILRTFAFLIIAFSINWNKERLTNPLFIVFFSIFSSFYLSVAFSQGKLGMGFYFLRLYFEPLVAFYLTISIANEFSYSILKTIRSAAILAVIISLISVVSFYFNLSILNYFHGNKEINDHWFLGLGRFIYRAGFPIGGPNQLGLFYSSVFILNFIHPISNKTKNFAFNLVIIIGLAITFSKSALLALLVFLFIFNLLNKKVLNLIPKATIAAILLLLFFIGLDTFLLDGYLKNYAQGLISKNDLSTQGHHESLIKAINNFKDYCFSGYEKGTVGPRAKQFSSDYKNVESSLFLLLYDMGVPMFLVYLTSSLSLFSSSFTNYRNASFIIAVSVPYMFLPLIHSIEITTILLIFSQISGYNFTKSQ